MLPQGFTRVEWIESTGEQYIDTGFIPNQDTRIELTVAYLGSGGDNIAGVRNSTSDTTNRFGLITFGSTSKIGAFFRDSSIQAIAVDNHVHTYDLSKSGLYVDSALYGSANSGTFSCTYNFTLFAWNNGSGGVACAESRIYLCKIYDNGTLARDFIPCRNPDGEAGLYDMVGGQFYGNDGMGEFLAGGVVVREDVPNVPEALEYTLAGNIVALTWSASSSAEKYRVYLDYGFIAETTSTEYTDTIAKSPVAHVYAVTAVNEFGESDFSEPVRVEYWGDTAPDLIYDRTQADVDDAKALISKYMRGEVLDGYEQELWERGLRGYYNTSDVNRVEYHTRELQNILNANGYNIHIDTQLWAKPDIMRYSDIIRYLGNIKTILDAFGRSANAPELPSIDRWIDYIAANDIEKILYVTRELIYGALAMFRRAGTFTAGNDYVTQVIRRA